MGEMRILTFCLLGILLAGGGAASLPSQSDDYTKNVQPLLAKYCHSCHGAVKPKAEVNLVRFASEAAVRAERKLWKSALQLTESHQMPPENAKVQPPPEERARLVAALKAVLNKVDPKAPLDPGRVTLNPDCGFAPGSAAVVDIDEVYTKLRHEAAASRILRQKYA